MSYGLQFLLGSLLQLHSPWAPGPLPLVFASFVPFLLDIPATSDFTVMGYKMTDKVRQERAGPLHWAGQGQAGQDGSLGWPAGS